MPRYDYFCKECTTEFTIVSGMNDSRDQVVCTSCDSSHVRRIYSSIIFGRGTKAAQATTTGGGCGGCSPQGCGCHH